jgi:hypothetical protein
MIFLSIGLPSRFAEWCDLLASRLMERALGPTELVGANTLEEIGHAAVKSPAEHLLIGARQPAEDLRGALAAVECGFVIALDDPRAALQNLVVVHGMEWTAATRAIASSCAAMLGFTLMPQALVLRAHEDGRDPVATAGAIASCFGLELDADEIAACAAALPPFGAGDPETGTDPWWEGIDRPRRKIAAGALTGYASYFGGHALGEIIWARELFFVGDDPQRSANGVIDLAGGIRNLVFGPYIALPPGEWGSTVSLAVSKEAAGMNLSIEIIAGPRCITLARATIAPDDQGLCRATLAFTVEPSTDQPISFRIFNLFPALGGRLALAEVALTEQTAPRAAIPIELSTALGL